MARINRSHKKRNLEDHIVAKTTITETDAVNSPVKDIPWDVQQAEVHSDIQFGDDLGHGRPIILRQFEYRFPPGIKQRPTEEQILTEGYKKFLESTLYFTDELELVQEPKVVIGKKGFRIFATCQARKGSLIYQRPQTLKQITNETR